MTGTSCRYTDEQVQAFATGELGGAVAGRLAEHLGTCPPCRDAAVDYRILAGALDACCTADAVRWDRFETPFGAMWIAATSKGLVRVSWDQEGDDGFVGEMERRFPGRPVVRDPDPEILRRARRQLEAYFREGDRAFDLPLDLDAVSDFDRGVLEAALELGPGQVAAYGELARRIGRPTAARAVGGALGRNPVAIVVPCHRVVRKDGSLGGYGGGVEYKEALLRLEGRGDLLRAG